MRTRNEVTILKSLITQSIERAYPHAVSVEVQAIRPLNTSLSWKSVAFQAQCKVRFPHNTVSFTAFGGQDTEDPRSKQRTFRILERLWHKGFDHAPYLVSEPITYNTKHALLLYKLIPGTTLYAHLPHYRKKTFDHLVGLTGSWSAMFHAIRPVRGIPRDTNRFDKKQKQIMDRTFSHDAFFSKQEIIKVKQLTTHLFQRRLRIRARVRCSMVHDDFHPQNIIVLPNNKSIAVIDFDKARLDDPLDDVAEFLLRMETELYYRKAPGHIRSRVHKRFLTSYQRKRRVHFSPSEQQRIEIHLQWTALRLLQYTLDINYGRRLHRHNPANRLCQIEDLFWNVAKNPKLLVALLY